MKIYRVLCCMLGAMLVVYSCNDIDSQNPESGSMTGGQIQETNSQIPERVDATFSGMYSMMGRPWVCLPDDERGDDFGFISMAISLDFEGSDMTSPNNDYNWFSSSCKYATRDAHYAIPLMRYTIPYRQMGIANEVIASFPANETDSVSVTKIAQARAIRAFDYLNLAPYFQFGYSVAADKPCVPLMTDGDKTNNSRATVEKVYETILEDLDYAIEHLEGFDRGTNKSYIDQQVAYGLRARTNLLMGKYAEAAADAEKAMVGYTPASIQEVSSPSFCNISEHNWMWGIIITADMVKEKNSAYATCSSWLSSFSADSYTAGAGCYASINKLLYDKIPQSDVRHGWWLNENCCSPLLEGQKWGSAVGQDIVGLSIEDVKIPMYEYVNVKFGMKSGIGSTVDNNDFPLMRVEEMILIRVEGLAKSGRVGEAKSLLTDFVKTYRDPEYKIPSTRSFEDEIWFQRRVELWGEGFAVADAKRLVKPIVRFHKNEPSNLPVAFQFNIAADDGWMNMRFPQTEKNNNLGIVDNVGGTLPVPGQNPDLKDGVTD